MLDEVLRDFAEKFQAKAEAHFAKSDEPMYAPRALFDAYQPYLTGVYVTEEDESLSGTDLPPMFRIVGWLPS